MGIAQVKRRSASRRGDAPLACLASGCEFCARVHIPERSWYDWAVLERSEGFTVVAALGALVPGYVLVFPDRHVSSFAGLDEHEFARARHLVDRLGERYRSNGLGDDLTIFEHGCQEGTDSAGCIDHAHWHVVPMRLDLPRSLKWKIVDDDRDLRRWAAQAPHHLMVETGGRTYVSDVVPNRQYLRRCLAKQIGRPDEWDYVAFPHLDDVARTIEMMTVPSPVDVHG